MSDRLVVAMAAAAACGALARWTAPWWLAALLVAGALVLAGARRSAALVVAATFVLTSLLAARAWEGLHPRGLAAGQALSGVATLVSDPVSVFGGERVDVRIGGRRLRATSGADLAGRLSAAAAGERWWVYGRYSPLDDGSRDRLASRHIAGRLRVAAVRHVDDGTPWARAANGFRRLLERGVRSLPPARAALFRGVVLGDDRDQDVTEVEDFRASGLSHLLAVSGQNVAFYLGVLGPVLRRLRLATRYVVVLLALGEFVILTRGEPSVLRAAAMAAVTVLASTAGRPVSAVRVLALAATGLLIVDPLLVRSVGFVLSVSACVGLAVVTPRLRAHLPDALAVTLGAQLAVLPVLLATFGPAPSVSLVANLLAGPAAGPLMMWGLTGGAVAGLCGEPFAAWLHLPTRLLLAWVSGVARWSAGLALPWIGLRPALALAGAAVVVAGGWTARRRPVPRGVWMASAALGSVGVLAPAASAPEVVGRRLDTAGHDHLWRSRGTVVVTTDAAAPAGQLLGALRVAGVRAVDVLVVSAPSRRAGLSLQPVLARLSPELVLGPAGTQVPGAVAVETDVTVSAGPFAVAVHPSGGHLEVRIGSARAAGPRRGDVRRDDPGARDGHPQPDP